MQRPCGRKEEVNAQGLESRELGHIHLIISGLQVSLECKFLEGMNKFSGTWTPWEASLALGIICVHTKSKGIFLSKVCITRNNHKKYI